MNDQIKQIIIENFSQGKDFVLEQAPDVIQQVISSTTLSFSVGMVLSALVIVALLLGLFKYRLKDHRDRESIIPLTIVFIISVSIIVFTVNLYELIDIYLYPKAYLLKLIM